MSIVRQNFLLQLGNFYGILKGGEESGAVVVRFFGIFFAFFQSSAIWGALISSIGKPSSCYLSYCAMIMLKNLSAALSDCSFLFIFCPPSQWEEKSMEPSSSIRGSDAYPMQLFRFLSLLKSLFAHSSWARQEPNQRHHWRRRTLSRLPRTFGNLRRKLLSRSCGREDEECDGRRSWAKRKLGKQTVASAM